MVPFINTFASKKTGNVPTQSDTGGKLWGWGTLHPNPTVTLYQSRAPRVPACLQTFQS